MTDEKLAIRGISKTFPGKGVSRVRALQDISLSVRQGEFVSLIGPSGSGKSSLLDIIAGLSLPDAGDVLIDGRSKAGERGHVSYMPQRDVLFPWRTILDNVIVPLQIQGVEKKQAREEATRLLPVFGLEQFAASYPHMLSGGMRQRAAFLRTYLCKKELILLDEPFGSLDALTRMQMQQWLLGIWQQFRHSVLLVTHDVDEAILLSDRIYLLSARPGEIVAEVDVPLPRPREPVITTDPAFLSIKSRLLQLLQEAVFSNVVDS
ncbi:ABC transporter ATP-binding protein [Brevibacillus humidisoli]|uniref:ABC transporter ATP-binding protein n=1 Tax=Brevibacillus humidisoli TaxID=2895522 RepID=UPI001E347644|nr:ABC transporter ATP-binding protein [Brevibacillus humidisoli]UFJ40252.1 ABC transporter ATP-binding protein [Brevibacillus humidisoli]